MGDGEHGGRHEPRQAHDGAHAQHDGHDRQVQVVAAALLQHSGGSGVGRGEGGGDIIRVLRDSVVIIPLWSSTLMREVLHTLKVELRLDVDATQ